MLGEIPAASAGMTDLDCAGMADFLRGYGGFFARGWRISFCVGVAERVGCGRRQAGAGVGGVLGEIPAASAGMTDLNCADMADLFAWV